MLFGFQRPGIDSKKGNMKRILSVLLAILTVGVLSAWAQSTQQKLEANKMLISLADARSRIDKAIETPVVMTAIMQHLSAGDQKQFLADVNKAIGDLPASLEEKAAKFLNINHAALKGATKGNVATLLAEVFATVSPEALTVINERFAIDLLDRSGNPNVTYTDEQFTKIATDVMVKVIERCAETSNCDPRCGFAILMLVRASGGTPADLAEKLIGMLKTDEAKELARHEWIPQALEKGDRGQNYEAILASADAGRRPDYDFVLVVAGPQYGDSVLQDILGKGTDPLSFISTRTPVLDAVENPLRHSLPIIGGDISERPDIMPQPDEGRPYSGQILH